MKRIKVEAKISEMRTLANAGELGRWLDELEERDARVRMTIEEIEPREGILVETE